MKFPLIHVCLHVDAGIESYHFVHSVSFHHNMVHGHKLMKLTVTYEMEAYCHTVNQP